MSCLYSGEACRGAGPRVKDCLSPVCERGSVRGQEGTREAAEGLWVREKVCRGGVCPRE